MQLTRAHQAEIESITQSQKGELDTSLAQLQSELSRTKLEHEAALKDLQAQQKKNADVSASSERTQSDLRDAQQTVLRLQEELKAASEQHSTAPIASSDADTEKLNKSLQEAQTELSDTQEALRMSQMTFQENLEQMQRLHAEQLTEKEEARVGVEATLKETAEKQKVALESLKGQMEQLKKEQRPLSPASPTTSARSMSSQQQHADQELVSLHNAHNAKLHEKESELERLRDANSSLEEQVSKLKFEISLHEQDQ